MVLFDPDYAPTRKQSFRAAAGLALFAGVLGNGLVTRLSLDRAGLTGETALEAVAAIRPDLIAPKPRSAGLVLPVREATDTVEADI